MERSVKVKAALKIVSSVLMITRQSILLYKVISGEIPECADPVPDILSQKTVKTDFDMLVDTWDEQTKTD